MAVMRLRPAVSQLVWGGKKLITHYGIQTTGQNAAEAWMLSGHSAGESILENGPYAGQPLSQLFYAHRELFGSKAQAFSEFPILIKLIDAQEDLSIQVHPDDAYCEKTGAGQGKTEAWYILDCEPGAQLLLGFREELSREQFEQAIQTDALPAYAQAVAVRPGEFYFIPAGTLHAICGGVLLAEVQQNSNTTFRVYDYNRPGLDGKPRELHINQALDVTITKPYAPPIFEERAEIVAGQYDSRRLCRSAYFQMDVTRVTGAYTAAAGEDSFLSLLVLAGSGTLTYAGETCTIQKGESLLIPAGSEPFTLCGRVEVLETRL